MVTHGLVHYFSKTIVFLLEKNRSTDRIPNRVSPRGQPVAVLESYAEGMPRATFAVTYTRLWTPKMVVAAVAHAERNARLTGLLPMVVAPYLSDERLQEFERHAISGVDLCGNGVVVVPSPRRWQEWRTIFSSPGGQARFVCCSRRSCCPCWRRITHR